MPSGGLRSEVAEGLRWVYRHPTLGPLALNGHVWFIFWGISGAVLVTFVLQTVHLDPLALGIALSLAGVGGLAGSLAAPRLGRRFGTGRTVVASQGITVIAYVLMALARPVASPAGSLSVLGSWYSVYRWAPRQ